MRSVIVLLLLSTSVPLVLTQSGSSGSGSSPSSSSSGSARSKSEAGSNPSSYKTPVEYSGYSGQGNDGKKGDDSLSPPQERLEVTGIRCIGYLDAHGASKEGHGTMKYKAFDQFCPGDKYCATFVVKLKHEEGSLAVDYSGCAHFFDEDLCKEGTPPKPISIWVEGTKVEGNAQCCKGDYCNRKSNLKAVVDVDPKLLKKEPEIIRDNESQTTTAAPQPKPEKLQPLRTENTSCRIAFIALSALFSVFYIL